MELRRGVAQRHGCRNCFALGAHNSVRPCRELGRGGCCLRRGEAPSGTWHELWADTRNGRYLRGVSRGEQRPREVNAAST